MFQLQEQIRMHNSKKWKYDQIIPLIDEAEKRFTDIVAPEKGNDYISVLNESFQKALLEIKEIVTLVYNGFPNGAMALAKELYEQMVLLCYFEKNQQDNLLPERYFDDGTVKLISESIQLLQFLHSGAEDEKIRQGIEEMLEHKRKMYDGLRKKYEKRLTNGAFKAYWWAEDGVRSFQNIHKQTQWYQTVFRHIYETACHQNSYDVPAGPALEGYQIPVCFSLKAFGSICQTVFYHYEIPFADLNQTLESIVKPMLSEIWKDL